MELISWAWMTTCIALVFFIMRAYILCVVSAICAGCMFYAHIRKLGVTEDDILKKVKSLDVNESSILRIIKLLA